MANREVPLDFPATLTKTTLTPNELKSLITSKVHSVLLNSGNFSEIQQRIKERRDNVIQRSSLSVTREGNLDRRRASTETFVAAGIVPAPENQDQNFPGPQRIIDENLHEGLTRTPSEDYTQYLIREEKDCQDKLFQILLPQEGKLDPGLSIVSDGVLQRNNRTLTAIELCNELDKVTRMYATESIEVVKQGLEARRRENEKLEKLRVPCFIATLKRIFLMTLYEDDIFSVRGYNQWRKHALLIASFATLTIALDLFFDHPIEL